MVDILAVTTDVNMLIDELEKYWAIDGKIDPTLEIASVDGFELHHKYSKFLNAAKIMLAQLNAKRDKLILLKTDYFLGQLSQQELKDNQWKPNPRTILKADLPMHLAADDQVIKANLDLAEIQQCISFLESIMRMIHNRNFYIKNAIEVRKFNNGVN